MDALLRDLRFTLRSLRGSLRLTLAAIGCVALGTGGAVFILTIADAILLQAPPFAEAERLVRIWTVQQATGRNSDVSWLDVQDIAARSRSFDAIEAAARTRAALSIGDGTERVRGESVTPGYFGVIGVQPAMGRLFAPAEYEPDAPRVMVISHSLWMRSFGGRADVVGEAVNARGSTGMAGEGSQLITIIGVMPPGFEGTIDPDDVEFWLPIEQYTPRALIERRTWRGVWVLARLRRGTTIATAQAEVASIGRALAAEYPEAYRDLSLGVEPVGESWRQRFRPGLTMLSVAAGLLLLIACVNIAYLLLARVAEREYELQLRSALGASRASLIRQLVAESLLLTTVGGVIGGALAVAGVRFFARAELFSLPSYVTLEVDAGSMVNASGIILLTAVLAGVLPAWLGSRVGPARPLSEMSRSGTASRRQRLIVDGLVGAEVAFSFLLLTGSMLMVRTYANLLASDVGYRTERLQRLAITLDPMEYPTPETRLAFVEEARAALRAEPGVSDVSIIAGVLPPWFDAEMRIAIGGVEVPELSAVQRHAIDDAFFRVMEIPLREGRMFATTDVAGSPRVAIVSRSLARALVGGDGRDAIGSSIQVGTSRAPEPPSRTLEIVGIVEDVRYHGPRSDRAADHDLYVPIAQAPDMILSIAVTTIRDPALIEGSLRRTLGRLAPTSPQHWISTMEGELAAQFGDARLYAWLTAVFGASALLLVAIGIYGVMSNGVRRRWAELGIRMAVGARPSDIVVLVLGQATRPMVFGLVIGVAAAAASATLAQSLVFGIAPTDPGTFAIVAAAIVGIGLVACYLPARRAARLDPRQVLQA